MICKQCLSTESAQLSVRLSAICDDAAQIRGARSKVSGVPENPWVCWLEFVVATAYRKAEVVGVVPARDVGEDREARQPFLLAVLGWTARDAVGFVVGTVAVVAILVNVLYMQSGLHPAPLFKPAEAEPKAVHPVTKPLASAPVQRADRSRHLSPQSLLHRMRRALPARS